jgi:hypothetical protein
MGRIWTSPGKRRSDKFSADPLHFLQYRGVTQLREERRAQSSPIALSQSLDNYILSDYDLSQLSLVTIVTIFTAFVPFDN